MFWLTLLYIKTKNRYLWISDLIPISGLPPTGSWQDLKDHMREAGDVCFADVYKDGTGVCEYVRYEDMKYALKKLDDTKFKSHEVKNFFSKSREIAVLQ